jgi:ubiquitin-like 1-activating enzyme E1 A
MADLTDEQAAIYDRQIRVWGADVQRRLTEARVLMLGCTPLASEVSKNFVLAGIGHLTVIDSTPAADSVMTFLHNTAVKQKGCTVADLFAAGLQELNPMVTVQTAPGGSDELPPAELIKQQQLVLAFGLHGGQQQRLNAACRQHGVGFLAARTFGFNAAAFLDLPTHQCKVAPSTEQASSDDQVTLTYKPLSEALDVPWSSLSRADKRQLNPMLPAWVVVTDLEIASDRAVSPDDLVALDKLGSEKAQQYELRAGSWQAEVLREVVQPQGNMAAVDAIVGGFLGNDVVRIISHVGVPTHNLFLFRLSDNMVQVHNLTGTPGYAECKV